MKYDISFWNYTNINTIKGKYSDIVKEWKTLGVTIGFSFHCTGSDADIASMHKLLKACDKEGIQIIINDKRVFWTELQENGEHAYIESAFSAVRDFGMYKCVLGFYLGDEPSQDQFNVFGRAHFLFKKCTDKVGFMNFCCNSQQLSDFGGMENYRIFLRDFIAKFNIEIVSFDRYSQLHAFEYEENFIETGINRYFEDLIMFSGIAQELKLPLFASLSSCGHFMYRAPSREDIRWQLAVALAHGASCAQWFMLYQHKFHDDYYTYPIELNGARTDIFHNMQNETFQLENKVVDKLKDFKFNDVWHVARSYGGNKLLKEGGALYVYSDHGKPGIVTEFKDTNGNLRYLVTNACQSCPELFHFQFKDTPNNNYYMWLGIGCSHVVKYDLK